MQKPLTWKVVDDTATLLGVSDEARRKWRQSGRGVPHEWRFKIAEALEGEGYQVGFADFEALPEKPGRIAA